MENAEVFNEIQTRLEALEKRVAELEKMLGASESVDIIPDVEIDLDPEPIAEPEAEVEPAVEPADEPEIEPEPVAEPEPEEPIELDIDIEDLGGIRLPDLKSFQWMNDIPGGEVANMISAISLNDRVLFINTLFREEPSLFQSTIGELNKMQTMEEAVPYLIDRFPEWNLNSEVVYRFMMAARRKLK